MGKRVAGAGGGTITCTRCLPERFRVLQVMGHKEMTPLHCAVFCGHVAVVEMLLAAGADKEAKNKVRGEVG